MTDPSELTVAEIEETIQEIEEVETVREIEEAERDGKDRVTAIEAIEQRLEELDTDDEADEDDEDETLPSGHIRVRPAPGSGGGHIAGYSFEPAEVKGVPPNAKVQKALMRGKLQRVA